MTAYELIKVLMDMVLNGYINASDKVYFERDGTIYMINRVEIDEDIILIDGGITCQHTNL